MILWPNEKLQCVLFRDSLKKVRFRHLDSMELSAYAKNNVNNIFMYFIYSRAFCDTKTQKKSINAYELFFNNGNKNKLHSIRKHDDHCVFSMYTHSVSDSRGIPKHIAENDFFQMWQGDRAVGMLAFVGQHIDFRSQEVVLQLYKTLVRRHLDYWA